MIPTLGASEVRRGLLPILRDDVDDPPPPRTCNGLRMMGESLLLIGRVSL